MKATKEILVAPVLSEKSSDMRFDTNHYVFRVKPTANKIEIKKAVETRFNVIVDSVRTLNVRGKIKSTRGVYGQQASWKKAFIRVRQGDSIAEFEGA